MVGSHLSRCTARTLNLKTEQWYAGNEHIH